MAPEKHVAVLLSNIGSKPYGVLLSLAVPKTPKELKYADVEKILKDHYEPAPLVTYQEVLMQNGNLSQLTR